MVCTRKKCLALLLAVLMVCAQPLAVRAAGHHEGFTAFPADAVPNPSGGEYYLDDDIDIQDASSNLEDIRLAAGTICLNGHNLLNPLAVDTLTLDSCNGGVASYVKLSNGELTLKGSAGLEKLEYAGGQLVIDGKWEPSTDLSIHIPAANAAPNMVSCTEAQAAKIQLVGGNYHKVYDGENGVLRFVANPALTLSAAPADGTAATGSVSASSATPAPGAEVTLTATAQSGSVFDHWLLPDGSTSTENPCTFTALDADMEVKGYFAPTVAIDGDPLFFAGSTDSHDFTAKLGGTVTDPQYLWTLDGTELGTAETQTLTAADVAVGEHTLSLKVYTDTWDGGTFNVTLYGNGITDVGDTTFPLGSVTPNATAEYGTITYTYAAAEAGPFAADKPNTVGTWHVRAAVSRDEAAHAAAGQRDYAITVQPAITPASGALKEGDTLTLSASSGSSYQWYCDGAAIDGATGASYTVPTGRTGKFVYHCEVDSIASEVDSIASEDAVVTVNGISDLKIDDWAAGDTPATPSATAAFGTITYTYAPSESGPYTTDVPVTAGKWYVKAAVEAGTDADGAAYAAVEATTPFTIAAAPASVSVMADAQALTIEDGKSGSVNLVATAKEAAEPITYKWTRNGVEVKDATGATLAETYTVPGTYTYVCTITDKDGKTATSDPVIVKVNGITGLKIADWAYGDTPATPSATAAFGEISYTYAPAGSTDFTATSPTLPGSYVLKAAVAAGTDTDGHAYTGAEATVNFTVRKAVGPAAPTLRYMDSVIGYNTGMIFDLDATMEYQTQGESVWHPCTETTLQNLAAGTYFVRVRETATTLPSVATRVEVKSGNIPLSARYRFTYVPLTTLPDALKSHYATFEDLRTDMLNKVKANAMGGAAPEGYALYDVSVQFSVDNGVNWYVVTDNIFPAQGVAISLPYPSGTSGPNYDFYCAHVFTANGNGHTAGAYEYPRVAEGSSYLQVVLSGTSPLLIAYRNINSTVNPSTPPTNNTGNGGTGGAVATGDTNNPLFWGALLGVSALSLGAAVALPKLRKRKSDSEG